MTTVKAPCLNKFCSCQAEYKKGTVKWVMSCPDCGSQFYQSKKAKEEVAAWLEKHKKPDEPKAENSNEANENNGGNEVKPKPKDEKKPKPKDEKKPKPKDEKKPKPKRLFGHFFRGKKDG